MNCCYTRGEGGRRGHGGGGGKFDSRSQLAPRIQDALGRMVRGGRESEAEVERVSLYRSREEGTTDPFSLCTSPLGEEEKCERGQKETKGYEKNMKERNRH